MADPRMKALQQLGQSEDMSMEDYMKLLKKYKEARRERAIASQEEQGEDYFDDVSDTQMQVSDVIDQEIPLEEQERMARERLRRKRLGLE